MEITIKDKKFIFKEEMSGREENDSGIMFYLSKFLSGSEVKEEDLQQIVFTKEFDKVGTKMVSFMSLEPKMTLDEVKDLPASNLFRLKFECLLSHISQLEKIKEIGEKKSLTKLESSIPS